MARKICTSGKVGPYSYVIVDTDKGVYSALGDDINDVVTTHAEMEIAEKWKDRELNNLIGRQNEID